MIDHMSYTDHEEFLVLTFHEVALLEADDQGYYVKDDQILIKLYYFQIDSHEEIYIES